MIPPGYSILFDDAVANIPEKFERDTRADGKFLKGCLEGAGESGGAATHSHTSPNHAHAIANHTHTGSLSYTGTPVDNFTRTADAHSNANHKHDYTTGNPVASNSQNVSLSLSGGNIPAHYNFIAIKSLAYNLIPINGCVFSAINQSGLTQHAASKGKLIKIADTGNNPSSGTPTNNHFHQLDHNHDANTHAHYVTTGSANNNPRMDAEWSSGAVYGTYYTHTHTFLTGYSSQLMNAYDGDSDTQEPEPLHTKLNLFVASEKIVPDIGVIAFILDDETPIYPGWALCNGENGTPDLDGFFIKNPNAVESPSTAGSNTHSHATVSHAHTGLGTHSHTVPNIGHSDQLNTPIVGNGTVILDGRTATHASNPNTSAVTANYNSANLEVPSTDNQPPYIKVRFVQLIRRSGGSGIMSKFVN